jgi:hypothetical protein
MIIWIICAFGSGKTQTAFELNRRLENSYVYDPENIGYFFRRNMPGEIIRTCPNFCVISNELFRTEPVHCQKQ